MKKLDLNYGKIDYKWNSVEVEKVKEEDLSISVCDNNERPDFYSVYLRDTEGLAWCIADLPNKKQATLLSKLLIDAAKNYVDPTFPNDFINWQETHYQVVEFISTRWERSETLKNIRESSGSMALMTEASQTTFEFENKYKGQEWIDIEWLDTIEEFLITKYIS